MAKAVTLARSYVRDPAEVMRLTIVLACTAALILAERALPFF